MLGHPSVSMTLDTYAGFSTTTWTAWRTLSITLAERRLLPKCCHGHRSAHEKGPDSPMFHRGVEAFTLAVTAGFEPAVACTTHAFQACSFGRSDTSPGNNLSILSDAPTAA